MKLNKLITLVKGIESFSDMWDSAARIYESRSHDFEWIRKDDRWICKVIKVTKNINKDKSVTYQRSFVLSETGFTMEGAFIKSSLSYLEG